MNLERGRGQEKTTVRGNLRLALKTKLAVDLLLRQYYTFKKEKKKPVIIHKQESHYCERWIARGLWPVS